MFDLRYYSTLKKSETLGEMLELFKEKPVSKFYDHYLEDIDFCEECINSQFVLDEEREFFVMVQGNCKNLKDLYLSAKDFNEGSGRKFGRDSGTRV